MTKFDAVNPNHYADQKVQSIEFMQASMTREAFRGFLQGNVFKYVGRYKRKNGVEDLNKAKQYLEWLIQHEDSGKIIVPFSYIQRLEEKHTNTPEPKRQRSQSELEEKGIWSN